MTQTILCAVDINRADEDSKVVAQAKKMADLDGAQLDIITVVPDFGASVVGAYFKDHDVKSAKDGAGKYLNNMVVKAIGAEANASVRHVVAVGSVYEEVLKAAQLAKAD
ncbi:MAG: universal stress protein, partial [Pseudoruegeria sp.]